RMLAPRSLVLGVCFGIASFGVTAHAAASNIRGVVVMTGAVVPKKVPVTIDQYVCGKEKVGEDLAVSPQGGVKNVVVWLQTPPPAPATVGMDRKGCPLAPRGGRRPAGGTVEFLNSDRLLHNLHSSSRENPTFNRTQPRGRVIPVTFSKPEFVQVNCDLHSWMR